MGWQATGILYGFFAWDYWGGVWCVGGACNLQCNGQRFGVLVGDVTCSAMGRGLACVGGACNLQCNGQSSFENQGSIPLQVTTIFNLGMCLKVCMYP